MVTIQNTFRGPRTTTQVRMHRMLLLAAALWTDPGSLAGASRGDRRIERDSLDYESTLSQDATTTTSGDASEICCACPDGERTYPPGSICPSRCTQRPEQGGCTVWGVRESIASPIHLMSPSQMPQWICCNCLIDGKGHEERTLRGPGSCPKGCKKKGEGTRLGQPGHGKGDQACNV